MNKVLELVSKLLSAAIGCKARGTALSAKRGLDVIQYASEPFPPPALPTNFSLDLASKSVLKPVLGIVRHYKCEWLTPNVTPNQ